MDDWSDTRATHSDDFLLQSVGGLAALLLPAEDKDLLLDGDGVEAVVLLPQWVHTAGEAALGISDHLREAVGVLIKPVIPRRERPVPHIVDHLKGII